MTTTKAMKRRRRVPSIEEQAAWAVLDTEQRKNMRMYLKWILGHRLAVFRATAFMDVERHFQETALAQAIALHALGEKPTHYGKVRKLAQIGAAMTWLRCRLGGVA